jgi:predicted MFS family arabinose efflux permease
MGASLGWRSTYMVLGMFGAVITLPLLMLKDSRDGSAAHERGAPFGQQVRSVAAALGASRPLRQTVIGFVLIHFAFASLAFVQLWLVRERGFDGASIAKQMGSMQIVFGTLGAVLGGIASDRFSRRFLGGHATVLSIMVLVFAPLMLAYRFATPGTALFWVGMCAGFILPLAVYGPANALIQALTPVSMRSTITGAVMMLINVFAIAIGNLAVGAVSDRLAANGSTVALTTVLIATDVLVALSLWFFWRAANSGDERLGAAADKSVFAH